MALGGGTWLAPNPRRLTRYAKASRINWIRCWWASGSVWMLW